MGTPATGLLARQALCEDVHISPIPPSITQSKKVGSSSRHLDVRSLTARRTVQALSHVAVNHVDLVDYRRTGKPVKLFPSKTALRRYSIRQEKIFPKWQAKEDGFLSALLIHMF